MENDKIRIVIDCDDEKETPQHWLTVGNVSRSYSNEADLADDLELLLEEDTSPLAA